MKIWINKLYSVSVGSILAILISLTLAFLRVMFSDSTDEAGTVATLTLGWQYITPLLISPIVEELIFRKWLPNKLQQKKINVDGSIIISNILFTVLHFDLFFLPYLANSFVYSHFYNKTKDIKVPIIIHLTYNWVIFIIACL